MSEINRPKVNVIIPTYNSAHFLGPAMESVLHQTFQDWDLIVVDDGSVDNTRDLVASFQAKDSRIRYLHQANGGHASARNRGLEAATGEYVAFLDADDLWLPEKLSKQVGFMDRLPASVGLVYTDAERFDDRDGVTVGRKLEGDSPPRGNVFRPLVRRDWGASGFIAPTTVLIRREVFERTGPFDEGLRSRSDWEMFVRIAASYEVEVLNEPLARKRDHPGNTHRSMERLYRHGEVACLKVLQDHDLEPRDRRALEHKVAGLRYGRALLDLRAGRRKEALGALIGSLRLQPVPRWSYPRLLLLWLDPRLYDRARAFKHGLV